MTIGHSAQQGAYAYSTCWQILSWKKGMTSKLGIITLHMTEKFDGVYASKCPDFIIFFLLEDRVLISSSVAFSLYCPVRPGLSWKLAQNHFRLHTSMDFNYIQYTSRSNSSKTYRKFKHTLEPIRASISSLYPILTSL